MSEYEYVTGEPFRCNCGDCGASLLAGDSDPGCDVVHRTLDTVPAYYCLICFEERSYGEA